ncbi:hypothetical protein BRADI_2g52187v3 [Brachypodium distachyon]|uniref:Uncharacterized protein n=1 Tax=Brachypodium distachyon TaxID=15368 RepID=A0A2K2DFG6_BRADI|nr:hypothetical protein BRADI_2g52187v3 [Brachypodium distachyon]
MAFLKTLNPLFRRNLAFRNPKPLLSPNPFLPPSLTAACPALAPFGAATHPHVLVRSGGALFLSSAPWMLSQPASPLTTAAAAFRAKLHRACAIAGGGAQAVVEAVRWEPRRVYSSEAAGAGGAGLVGLVVVRDLLLVGGAVYKRASSLGWKWNSWSDFVNLDAIHREKVEPLFISKVNTVFQLMLVAGALLQPEFGTVETQNYITYLSLLVATTTVASTVGYGVKYYQIRPRA